jgi:hypothetical protein
MLKDMIDVGYRLTDNKPQRYYACTFSLQASDLT